MTDAALPRRRQLTLLASRDAAHAIEAVREKLDPVQHRLIPAHVTLCREGELALDAGDAWRERLVAAAVAPITLTFGAPVPFAGHGVMMPCIAGASAFHALRVVLLGAAAPRPHEPHLTLAHPRNPRAPHNVASTYADLLAPICLAFTTVSLIEQWGHEPWEVLDTYSLDGTT